MTTPPPVAGSRVLVVDAANVVGSVPDGWWADRAGAARRLVTGLSPNALGVDAVVVVLEGAARAGFPARPERAASPANPASPASSAEPAVPAADAGPAGTTAPPERPPSGVTVVHAPGSGDDELVAQCAALAASGHDVTLATADRGLIARVAPLGVASAGPRTVRRTERT